MSAWKGVPLEEGAVRHRLVAVVLVMASAGSVRAQTPPAAAPKTVWEKEPATYRAIAWGATASDVETQMGRPLWRAEGACLCTFDGHDMGCALRDEPSPGRTPSARVCFSHLTIGSITLKESWHFLKDRFAGVYLGLDSDDFESCAIFHRALRSSDGDDRGAVRHADGRQEHESDSDVEGGQRDHPAEPARCRKAPLSSGRTL